MEHLFAWSKQKGVLGSVRSEPLHAAEVGFPPVQATWLIAPPTRGGTGPLGIVGPPTVAGAVPPTVAGVGRVVTLSSSDPAELLSVVSSRLVIGS
jgi:hypothetical protein